MDLLHLKKRFTEKKTLGERLQRAADSNVDVCSKIGLGEVLFNDVMI